MTLEALVLHPNDNVATAVRHLGRGQSVNINDRRYILLEVIPIGHKFALQDIETGEKIIKYGEIIGQATARIKQGEHVHIHNVEGLRGRGDRR